MVLTRRQARRQRAEGSPAHEQASKKINQQASPNLKKTPMGLQVTNAREAPHSHPLEGPMDSPRHGHVEDFTIPAAIAPAIQAAATEEEELPGPSSQPAALSIERAAPSPSPGRSPQPAVLSIKRAAPPPPPPGPSPQQAATSVERLLPVPRNEKPLKPLPAEAIPCDKLPDGPEPVAVEVEYTAREALPPLDAEPAAVLAQALAGLQSADWVETCQSLTRLRQLAVHRPEAVSPELAAIAPLVLKSVRSLRSSLCKTALMAMTDLLVSYGDVLLPMIDVGGQAGPNTSVLAQLLLKTASNDKKFVIEEAQRTLQTISELLAAKQVVELLLPYTDHKNFKVRGKAGLALAVAIARLQPEDIDAIGFARLLKVAGRLIADNSPDARESAKQIAAFLHAAYADPTLQGVAGLQVPEPAAAPAEEEAKPPPSKWQLFCQANLSPTAAAAVVKATEA